MTTTRVYCRACGRHAPRQFRMSNPISAAAWLAGHRETCPMTSSPSGVGEGPTSAAAGGSPVSPAAAEYTRSAS